MGKFIDINELREFCQQHNLEDEVRETSSLDRAKEIIKAVLPDGVLASKPTIRDYRNELKASQPNIEANLQNPTDNTIPEDSSHIATMSPVEAVAPQVQDASTTTVPEAATSETTNTQPINTTEKSEEENFKEDNCDIISSQVTDKDKKDASETEFKKTNSKKSESEPTESITSIIEGEKESVYVDKDRIKELDEARYTIKEHEKSISLLSTQLEELRQKLNVTSREPEKKNTFLSQIPNLNDLLNGGSEKITVSINKDLLSKATRFVDANSLINLESIIRDGYDLNSTIVQSILLAFIHQNSLL